MTDLQKVDAAGLLEGVKIANKARHPLAKIDREVARMHLANAAPDLAARVLELEAENKRLREGLDDVFEMWAGSEGFIPKTAPEGYLLELVKKMATRAALTSKGEG